jgi:signal transduction histidine kinase
MRPIPVKKTPSQRPAGDASRGGENARHADKGLRRKMWLAFTLQVAAISLATMFGVYVASVVLKNILINRALQDEASYYWKRHGDEVPIYIPDTFNMMGYVVPRGHSQMSLPEPLRGLKPGYHAMPEAMGGSLVYVDDKPKGRLILVFKQRQVNALAFWFGVVPLTFVLVVIYAIAWVTYRFSHRAISPVIWLANQVQQWDPKHPDAAVLDPASLPVDVQGETLVLASSLHAFATRIETYVQREREFTRDASHELRTPMTVIRMAGDILLEDDSLSPHGARTVQRIQASVREMESLVEAFLIMAREGDTGVPDEDFVVNEIVLDEIEKSRSLLAGKPVELRVVEAAAFSLRAPPRVFAVLFGNLLRNACNYTDRGTVTVRILADSIVIEDTGIGMDAADLAHAFDPFYRGGTQRKGGHGIGLNIVLRLSDRFGWPIALDSEPGKGTRASVRFPSARPPES